MIVSNLAKTVDVARRTVRLALARLPARRDCLCASALQDALITPLDMVPEETKRKLAPIIGKYTAGERRGS
jgi:5'-methylthioadenosine phosphorylase